MQSTEIKSWVEEYNERYPSISMMDVQVGNVATYYIGSDSYSDMVTNVVRFKSGARKGQVNYIQTTHEINGIKTRFYAREIVCSNSICDKDASRKDFCVSCNQIARGVYKYVASTWSGHVYVGHAKDYRDPHF